MDSLVPQAVGVGDITTSLVRVGQGPPVLFLHGAGSTWTAWSLNLGILSQRFDCVVPDLPGCGESSRPPRFWSVARYAEWTGRLLDALEIEQAMLVGNSFGALVAAETAARFPERVSRLGLVAPPAIDDDAAGRSGLNLLRLVRDDGVPRFATVAEARLISPFASEALLELANRNFATCVNFLEIVAAVAGYASAERMPLLKCPTWLAMGEADGLVPPTEADAWMRILPPGTRFTMFSRAGHCPQFDDPREFNRLLLGFLAA